MTRSVIDTTTLDATGGYSTFIAGLRNPGTVSLGMNFTRETYEIMKGDFEIDTPVQYEILLPDAESTSLTFWGLVTELPLTVPANDKVTVNGTIKVSGQVILGTDPSGCTRVTVSGDIRITVSGDTRIVP